MTTRKLPRLRRKLTQFLAGEDGKISKENLMKMGIMVSSYSIGSAVVADSVQGHADCTSECPDGSAPSDGKNVDKHNNYHGNDVSDFTYSQGSSEVSITHDHCVHDCHASHSSHSSY